MSSAAGYFDSEESLDYLYDRDEIYEETIFDIWDNCVVLSAISISYTLYKVILFNIIFGLIVSTGKISPTVFHILSGVNGLFLIATLHSTKGKILILICFILSYFLLHLGSNINKIKYLNHANAVKYQLVTSLVLCEYFLLEEEIWMEIRGIIMIFVMKIISLAEDIDREITDFPTVFQYFGYTFSGCNIMFGPWISFQEYIFLYKHPSQKSRWWMYGIVRSLFFSMLSLMVSNCFANFFIPDSSNRWLVAYKEALSFRTSHYFICYLSEASMLAAGYKNQKIWNEPKQWRLVITEPIKIEFPTALTIVVAKWNRPMHEFLKKYVYKSWLPLGKFFAVLMTFVMSSFLHGFEIKISIVLIAIGIFSYLQFIVRDHLARTFNCCIKVHPCKSHCVHKYKRNSLQCKICFIVFSFSTVLHLIYLGVLMDSSTDDKGVYEKWNNLYFVSFYIMAVNILIIM
ncbi:hypothetical protein NQ317_018701 [Molorchus minor]|uniref:Protein-serine O-palmitoleoyltransferase porcupine n=1 Tax=Molorchus minor TaxID=1323400 RepID=A0ABQ9JSL5_9CUCU|nr:hypothetical protein NQ317_018701 [Molorchus minor]